MDSTNDNESETPIIFNLIKYILYFIGFIIVLITFLAITNYLLYAIYYVKELIITTEEIYDVTTLQLTDIINYKLINYIKAFNPKNEKKFNLNNNKCYDLKKLKHDGDDATDAYPYDDNGILVVANADTLLETDFTEIIDNFKYNGDGGELKNIKAVRGNLDAIIKILYDSNYSKKDYTLINNLFNKIPNTKPDISGEIRKYFLDKFPKNIKLQNIEYNKLTDRDIKIISDSIKSKDASAYIQSSLNTHFYIKYDFIDYASSTSLGSLGSQKTYYFKFKLDELTSKENSEIILLIKNESIGSINHSLYDDIRNDRPDNQDNIDNYKINGKDGIIGYFKIDIEESKFNDFSRDVFGYALNSLYLLLPNKLLNSYDKDSSNLYILTNNKLYEMIFAIVFIIFLIIFILFTIDILYAIFINNDVGNTPYMYILASEKHYYLLIVPIIIIIYCMIHSIIYYYIFVKKAYVKIIELYDTLIKPDEYIRDIIIKLFGKNIIINSKENVNKELIKLFQYISYAGEINIEKAKYTVIDLSINEKQSVLKNFEENMLGINKHFNYNKYNHEANYYTKIFFEDFKKLFDNLNATNNNEKECLYLIIILSVYIYIVQWNIDDPYILIKLNKLLFGRVANIGIKEIDDKIANTLTLRSVIPYDITKNNTEKISGIYEGIAGYLEYVERDKTDIEAFEKLFKEVLEYSIERGEYNFNLYLAFEMGLNILTILIILMIIKLMSVGDNSEIDKNITYAKMLASWVVLKVSIAIFGLTNIIRFQ
jgi:hypothetical protein